MKKRFRSAIRAACLLVFAAGLPPVFTGCGDSGASTEAPKIDPVQAKSAEEATAAANKNRPKPQVKKY